MEAIILAGGKGTRLASRLRGIPKPLALVAGRPFLSWLLSYLAQQGFTRILLSVGHLHQEITSRFDHVYDGMRLDYVIEDHPLGTGGAIRFALAQSHDEHVFILNGDTFAKFDHTAMREQHKSSGNPLTLGIAHQDDVTRFGALIIDSDDRIVGFAEKGRSGPGWINAGVYLMRREFPWPANLPDAFSFENDVLVPMVPNLKPTVFRSAGDFIDIGVEDEYDRAQSEFRKLFL